MEIDTIKTNLQDQNYRRMDFAHKKIRVIYPSKHPTSLTVINY